MPVFDSKMLKALNMLVYAVIEEDSFVDDGVQEDGFDEWTKLSSGTKKGKGAKKAAMKAQGAAKSKTVSL